MTTKADCIFIDTNILVHASVENSEKYPACSRFLDFHEQQGTDLVISGQVIREFIRTMTRAQPTGVQLPHKTAIDMAEAFAAAYRVLDENGDVYNAVLKLTREHGVHGKQVHDANIVATMLAHNVPVLATENVSDFKRYTRRITLLNPLDSISDYRWQNLPPPNA